MITEDYVSFETAKLLMEKGFDVDECEVHYDPTDYTSCDITLQMAMKWLRENDVAIEIYIDIDWGKESHRSFRANIIKIKDFLSVQEIRGFSTHEEAVEAAIKYCLENLI